MLVIRRARVRTVASPPQPGDDRGAVLVVVVVLMLLGVVIATSIAASVVFTIGANVDNRSNTQAFIAAESGRDAALAAVRANIDDGVLTCSAGIAVAPGASPGPQYVSTVRWATSSDAPADWSSIAGGASEYKACPTETSNWIVIRSEGSADGSTSVIDAAYPWTESPDTRPAGTLAYFDSEFKATKSTYEGDLVIRGSGDYQCNNGAGNAIRGDLWITDAGMEVTGDCWVTGSIYSYGKILVKNKDFRVDGDIITEVGNINFEADNAKIGGDVYAGGNVVISKSGTLGNGKTMRAVGTVTTPTTWKHVDVSPVVGQSGQPKPVISPTLKAVHDATAWLELDGSLDWGVPPTTGKCSTADIKSLLETAGDPIMIDMSACDATSVTVNPGSPAIKRDAVLYVSPSKKMNLELSGTITKGAGDPQLLILHGDANLGDKKPTCSTGEDKLTVGSTIGVRTMIYSACGINKTVALTMTGQLYMGTDGLHLNGGTFTCSPMGWAPAFKNLSCGVKGSGGIFDPDKTVVSFGSLVYQTEDAP